MINKSEFDKIVNEELKPIIDKIEDISLYLYNQLKPKTYFEKTKFVQVGTRYYDDFDYAIGILESAVKSLKSVNNFKNYRI